MMLSILKSAIRWFTHPQPNVESYIMSKNPQSLVEVEFWIREWDKGVRR